MGIIQQGGNSYNLPGLNTLVNFTAHPSVVAKRGDDFVDFGYISDRTETGGWSLLGGNSRVDRRESQTIVMFILYRSLAAPGG